MTKPMIGNGVRFPVRILVLITSLLIALISASLYAQIPSTDHATSTNHSFENRPETAPGKWRHILILNDINGAYGSIGYSPQVRRVVKHAINTWQVELVISPGDLVAGQKVSLEVEQLISMWQGFEQQILHSFATHQIPFLPAMGNHDGSKYQSSVNRVYKYEQERRIASRFWFDHKPNVEYFSDKRFPYFYSVTKFGVGFVFIDASGFHITDDEFDHIEQLLKSVGKLETLFVVGHLPISGIAKNRNKFGEVIQDGQRLLSLFKQYNVDVYISGHQHAFYPGKIGNVLLLNSGGTPARQYVNSSYIAVEAVTVLSINELDKSFYTKTYNLHTLQQIDETQLPEVINGFPFNVFKASSF